VGLGNLFTRQAAAPVENRAVDWNFPIVIDGQPVYPRPYLYHGCMAVPGAARAVRLIADLIGSMPWELQRKQTRNVHEVIDPTPLVLEEPNPQEIGFDTYSAWAMDLTWHGNALGVYASRDRDGYPTSVLPVPAESVSARRVNGSEFSPIPHGAIEYSIGGQTFGQHDILHIKGPAPPGDVRGFGVLEMHMATLNLAEELQNQANTIGRHGVPTGVLRSTNPNATDLDLLAVKAKWLQNQRERSISVLNATTEFEPLSWNPEQLELVESRKFSLHEIALIFGLPPSFLGAETSAKTYSNIEQEAINLLKFSLNGYVGRFEARLSRMFPRGKVVRGNLDAVLRSDTLTRFQSYNLALLGKWMTPDEVRELERRKPLTESQLEQIKALASAGKPTTGEGGNDGGEQEQGAAGEPGPAAGGDGGEAVARQPGAGQPAGAGRPGSPGRRRP
jgi:HK97 family phage portal protein